MNARQMMVTAVMVAAAALVFGGESSAQGRGAGAGGGKGQGIQTRTHSQTQSANQVRPEGSQRRDGSFLTTGTRANGSTTRPTNGRGVMDGTGINHPPSTAP
ncbi:MAG: hypothetical protein LUP91_15005 [Methylococcaceae bacterium]|nr:hypothetical protein [Methylococcaceae bacterium]